MRVLFTTGSGSGHLHPLVPLARALQEAGHEVAVACRASFAAQVTAAGFPAYPIGDGDGDAERRHILAQVQRLPAPEQGPFFIAHFFAGVHTRRVVPALLDLCRAWRPDLIVREE